MLNYSKRLTEVDEILNYLPNEDLIRIPEKVRDLITRNKDNEYIWNYDETKSLEEQGLNSDTLAILAYLSTEYLLNEEQRESIKKIQIQNEIEQEKIKQEKFKTDNLYNKPNQVFNESEESRNVSLITNKENFFSIILRKIKDIFKKK